MSNYNSYGVHISKTQPKLRKGDTVKYKTNYRDTNGKLVFYYIYGKWNGNKAVFNDKDQHVIHTSWWLEKVTLKERLTLLLNNNKVIKYIPFIPIIGFFIVCANPKRNYGLSFPKSLLSAMFQTLSIILTILLIILHTL